MFESVPAGLDAMEPGPQLAGLVASIDVTRVSGHDRVIVLRAHARLVSHYQAQVYRDMAAIDDAMDQVVDDPEWAAEAAAAEVRAALCLTRRSADADMTLAVHLRRRLPAVWEALASGAIDPRRARVIVQGTAHLPENTARRVADCILERAPDLTTGEVGAALRRLCIEADPDQASRRYQDAVAERRVVMEASEAGTAHLLALDLPPQQAAAALCRINALARRLKTAGEQRSIDQLRSDIVIDLLTGATTAATRPGGVVDLRVDLATLARLSERPGDLAGYGPVVADIARQVTEQGAPGTHWRWTVTHPDTGDAIASGTTRRRPTARQRRLVESRDPTCIFPGCRTPARRCDLDHTLEWSLSRRTSVRDLGPLCRHDHGIRHHAGWRYRRLPNGSYQWITTLGHRYSTSGRSP
jgi:hypothetical protein